MRENDSKGWRRRNKQARNNAFLLLSSSDSTSHPSSHTVKAILFFLLLYSAKKRSENRRERHTHTNICTHPGLTDRNHYKSSRPYRGQHTDKYVSTPHPTDPSPKTSVTPRRKMWKYIHVNVRNGRLMIQPNPVAH